MNPGNHFDNSAKSWDADPVKIARALAVAEGIRQLVPLSRQMCALEYGCGTGLLSFALQPLLGHITLADSSAGMLAVLEEKIAASPATNMRATRLDLVSDPLPAERYDLVYSLMTLHHIDDIDRLLADLFALLAVPGYLCVADLDAEDGSFHGPGFTGHKGFDRGALERKAKRAGFCSVELSTVFSMSRPDRPGQTEFPVFLMVARKPLASGDFGFSSERPE
jgi:ubiquinone/menaquinone biosynthesis C-methylase UbiE